MENVDLLIRRCLIVPMTDKRLIENGLIAIKNGNLTFVGCSCDAPGVQARKEIDAQGKVALPGLINCHTHVPMTLFRGLADDLPLETWLKQTIWPLEAKLKPEDVYAGALLGCLEMIKSGTTCFGDAYFHEDMVARAVEDSGLRAVLAQGVVEAGNRVMGELMLRQSVSFAKKFQDFADGRVKVMLAPHAAYSCSERLLKKISKKASELNVGVHTHLAESRELFSNCEQKHGLSETGFLDELSLLNSRLVAAHCIDLSDEDLHVLARRGVNVVYCPVANMKLGLGVARAGDMAGLGINVSLGTDGPASNNCLDMFETMKIGSLLQKLVCQDPAVFSAHEVLRMATVNGARALGVSTDVGVLEAGKKADLILVDFRKPRLAPLYNVSAGLVYSASGSDVDTVIVDGKILMENRQVATLDEQAVMQKAATAAKDLLSR